MFKKLLEYQKIDGKILSLNREIESSQAKQVLLKVVSLVKDSQLKLIELENKAKALIDEYENCKNEYLNTFNKIEEMNKLDFSKLDENKVNEELEKLNKLTLTLDHLGRTLSFQSENVSGIIKNFEACRNNIVTYKQKYKEAKDQVDNLQGNILPEIDKLKKEMIALERNIDPALLNRYKHLRQEVKFPVIVPLNNNACGGCSMEIPAALMNKLKSNGYLECEQCHRYIYI